MFKKLLIILMCVGFLSGCATVGNLFGPKYICMAEQYPEITMQHSVAALGACVDIQNVTYCNIAEVKNPEEKAWIQFIDTNANGKLLDGKEDFAVAFFINDFGMLNGARGTLDQAKAVIEEIEADLGVKLVIHRTRK